MNDRMFGIDVSKPALDDEEFQTTISDKTLSDKKVGKVINEKQDDKTKGESGKIVFPDINKTEERFVPSNETFDSKSDRSFE